MSLDPPSPLWFPYRHELGHKSERRRIRMLSIFLVHTFAFTHSKDHGSRSSLLWHPQHRRCTRTRCCPDINSIVRPEIGVPTTSKNISLGPHFLKSNLKMPSIYSDNNKNLKKVCFELVLNEKFRKGVSGRGLATNNAQNTTKIAPQKQRESAVWEGFPCANPICPPPLFETSD